MELTLKRAQSSLRGQMDKIYHEKILANGNETRYVEEKNPLNLFKNIFLKILVIFRKYKLFVNLKDPS